MWVCGNAEKVQISALPHRRTAALPHVYVRKCGVSTLPHCRMWVCGNAVGSTSCACLAPVLFTLLLAAPLLAFVVLIGLLGCKGKESKQSKVRTAATMQHATMASNSAGKGERGAERKGKVYGKVKTRKEGKERKAKKANATRNFAKQQSKCVRTLVCPCQCFSRTSLRSLVVIRR